MAFAASMRRAGKRTFGADTGTDRCLDMTAVATAETPSLDSKWRTVQEPGVRVRPPGPLVRGVLPCRVEAKAFLPAPLSTNKCAPLRSVMIILMSQKRLEH